MDSIRNYIIGYWHNPQGQRFCTIVVQTNDFMQAYLQQLAHEEMEQPYNWSPSFHKQNNLAELSDEELRELEFSNDIYNQVDIIDYKCNIDNLN